MIQFERHEEILKHLQRDGSVTLNQLVDTLGHSVATIRRDFVDLEKEGKLVRKHGGAIYPPRIAVEPNFSEKKARALPAKAAIAGRVVSDIAEGATVFVDAGTSCMEAGTRLLERGKNPIFTNSIPLLVVGCNYPGKIVSIGGEVRAVSNALTGALALNWLDKLRFDYALIGASAIEGDSVRTTEINEAALKSSVIKQASNRYLLADAHKCEDSAAVEFAGLSDFDAWYVDDVLPENARPAQAAETKLVIIPCST